MIQLGQAVININLSNIVVIYDLRNCNFTNRVIPIWNSLRNQVGSAETVNIIQFRFDSVWLDQDVLYDYNADLHRKPFLYSSIMYITSSFQTFQ